MNTTSKEGSLFELDGVPKLSQAFPLALQHVVAMIVGCVTPAIIISGAAGLETADRVLLIQASLVVSALATLLQLFPIGKKTGFHLGAGLPVIIGVSFAYVPSMQAIADQGGMTGGMDMLSSFSAAGYDLQAFGAEDLAYGISRLRSDANMGSGPSLAANLRDSDGAAIFYRSTSWNRNRITNGMNYVITRAGYRIGFFSLADADTVNNKISLVNEETPFANDLTQTASEQVAALQAQGVDAIICIATPGVDTAALQTTLKDLGVTAIVDGSSSASGQDTLYRAGAALGLDGVARFDLVFTQGGGVAVRGADTVTADTLQASRSTWESLTITADDTQTGGDAADPDKDTEAALFILFIFLSIYNG